MAMAMRSVGVVVMMMSGVCDGLSTSWASLGLSKPVTDALVGLGEFEVPTAVQSVSIPSLVEGEDLLIHAQTGSGKTLAYMAPLMDKVDASRQTTQAVVVVPSRAGWETGASTSLQLVSFAMKCVKERAHSSRPRREMSSRSKR